MQRKPNTLTEGRSFPNDLKMSVWNKGEIIPNYDAAIWRRDCCGNVMKFENYGDRQTKYGWEIDHIIPVAHGGEDNLENLQPLYWENNCHKGDSLNWKCPIPQFSQK